MNAFLGKVHRLVLVLNRLERAYVDSGTRQTDFEIVDADKRNPTTLTLKPVPRVPSYNPAPALDWGIKQIEAVSRGEQPDERVRGEIASDLVKLATKESEYGYKAFWINGSTDAVRFDEKFLANAVKLAKERANEDATSKWHVGASLGTVVGELRKLDDLDADNEFVIVLPTGVAAIRCIFPAAMRSEMGKFAFKTVQVKGVLHYGEGSPFPYRVDAEQDGIELFPARAPRRTLSQLRGVFAERPNRPDWDSLLNG